MLTANSSNHYNGKPQQTHSTVESFVRKTTIEMRPKTLQITPDSMSETAKTNEWANSILKDLDSLMLTNKRYATMHIPSVEVDSNDVKLPADLPTSPRQKRSTIINVVLRKTTPSTSPISPTAPTSIAIAAAQQSTDATDNSNILKPEKHVSNDFDFVFSHLRL